MKIAFIGHKGYPATYGGIEKVVEELVNRLADRGHKCFVYSREYYSKPIKNEHKNVKRITISGIKTKRLDTLSHTFLSMVDVLKRDVDVVTIHSFGNSIFNFIPKFKGIKTAAHLHGFEFYSKKFSWLERKTILRLPLLTLKNFSDGITSVSYEDVQEMKKMGINGEYIPNGITSNYSDDNSVTTKGNNKYFLFVGRIVYQKGIEYLIDAFNKINNSEYELKIVGDHSHLNEYYESLTKRANNNPKINFLGYKFGQELVDLYKNAYGVIIPSEGEANPMVLLESLAMKKFVIASDITAIKYIADDYIMYFKSKSSEDLYEKIKYALDNPNVKEEYELKLHSSNFKEKYDWENIIDQYENLYLKLISQTKPKKTKAKKTTNPIL